MHRGRRPGALRRASPAPDTRTSPAFRGG